LPAGRRSTRRRKTTWTALSADGSRTDTLRVATTLIGQESWTMRNGGTTAAEIAIWAAAVGVGIAAVLVEGVASRTSLVIIATLLALVPVPIEIFRRRRFENSAPAQRVRDVADKAWDSAMRSHDPPDETPNSTMRSPEEG
jgi:hypothetical protein